MKFIIDYNCKKENRLLTYCSDEYGFNIEPNVHLINFGLAINFLDLAVVDDDNKVVEVSGYCGYRTWIKSNCEVPEYREGALKVADNLQSGIGSYAVDKEDFPIYVNTQTGWVCVGNPEKNGDTVEFITNCVFVIDSDKEFVALWLKPQSLPDLV